MHKLLIANGASEKDNAVKNVSPTWPQLKSVLGEFKIKPDSRSYILSGQCPSGVRGLKHGDAVTETHLLMLDFDNKAVGDLCWDEFEFDLTLAFDFHWAAYTTRSYTGSSVNFRVIVPFASGLDASKHRAAVEHVVSLLPDTYREWLDNCSHLANQPIFLPCLREEGAPHRFGSGGEHFIEFNEIELVEDVEFDESGSDLEDMLTAQPVDLTTSEVQTYLEALDPNTLGYGSDEGGFGWADVGMAIAHQFGSSDEGLQLWINWSSRNKEKHNVTGMASKYKSFDVLPRGRRPITFASVIAEVKERGGIMAVGNTVSVGEEPSPMDKMINAARSVDTLEQYNLFKNKIVTIDSNVLPEDGRSMLAFELYNAFGKDNGITRAIIGKALQPMKNESATGEGSANLPEWAEGWCYIEKSCEFYHRPTDHAIVREAFNARYDRKPECIEGERSASQFTLVNCRLPTYADRMYWPGAGEVFFDNSGKEMVNAYIEDGVEPSEEISADGQKAIDLMLAHLKLLVPDEREYRIVLNWLTHVYQNPGDRINWALLIQGAQGTGKSYFSVIMSYLLGRNARTLEAGAIAERFTGWAHGSVLTTIEEVRISGTSKFNILDRMKTYVSNETVQIEEKGRDHRVVPNFTNYLMLTNHKDALPMGDGDRRYCVIYTAIQSEKQLFKMLGGKHAATEYFDNLFEMSRKHICDIATFFKNRTTCEDFKPKGRAPETAARRIMQSLSVSGERGELENAISIHSCAAISDSVLDVTWLQRLAETDGQDIPKTRALSAILVEMGYEPLPARIYIAKTKGRHSVWHNPELANYEQAEATVKEFHENRKGDGTSEIEDPPF